MSQYQNQFDELRRQGQLAEAREAERQRQADERFAGINLRKVFLDNSKILIQRARKYGLVKNAFDEASFVSKYVATYIADGEEEAERLFLA